MFIRIRTSQWFRYDTPKGTAQIPKQHIGDNSFTTITLTLLCCLILDVRKHPPTHLPTYSTELSHNRMWIGSTKQQLVDWLVSSYNRNSRSAYSSSAYFYCSHLGRSREQTWAVFLSIIYFSHPAATATAAPLLLIPPNLSSTIATLFSSAEASLVFLEVNPRSDGGPPPPDT